MFPNQYGDRQLLWSAFRRADLTVEQLWLRYFALGGEVGPTEVEAYLAGLMPLAPLQHDMLAHAVNERLDELTPSRAPYSRILQPSAPTTGPLAALVTLLDGMHLSAPERLSSLAATAGRTLGVDLAVYLVDFDQTVLLPVTPSKTAAQPLSLDGTEAGRAFRQVRTIASPSDRAPRLWVPLLDGIERLGVLEVVLPPAADPDDPRLRTQCRWLSMLIGHLVTITNQYGDGLQVARLTSDRAPASELIWDLLPPLTAGTDSFVVAGMLEPCYRLNGDAFDYALSTHTATLAIFDATSSDAPSGIVTAVALAAYRAARRAGGGLIAQGEAVDDVLRSHFGPDNPVTGVLAELDLRDGRLHYLNAGHPRPLLVRSGQAARTLDGGRRPPWGTGRAGVPVGEQTLRCDDGLLLYTDGVVQAFDSAGAAFGIHRLASILERHAATQPPPETVRLLTREVVSHQDGDLRDDATVLLARWTQPAAVTS
jgi:hypothetical protein